MKTFETTLTGSDDIIDGVVTAVTDPMYPEAYRFDSIDDSLHIIITKNKAGLWMRIGGTEPYMLGWVDELAEKIENQLHAKKATNTP
jgi:hypothetical protein